MEQVISVIIMIAVGAFFAWIEKLSKKKAAATDSRLAAPATIATILSRSAPGHH